MQDFFHQQYVRVSLNGTHFWGGSSNANFEGLTPLGVPCWVCDLFCPLYVVVFYPFSCLFILNHPFSPFLVLCHFSILFFCLYFLSIIGPVPFTQLREGTTMLFWEDVSAIHFYIFYCKSYTEDTNLSCFGESLS